MKRLILAALLAVSMIFAGCGDGEVPKTPTKTVAPVATTAPSPSSMPSAVPSGDVTPGVTDGTGDSGTNGSSGTDATGTDGTDSGANGNGTGNTGSSSGLSTGVGVITSIASSKDAGDGDGAVAVDTVLVAVTLDSADKIVGCYIDTAQTNVGFSKDGKLTTSLDTEFKTKQELGSSYGMGAVSGIGKEWYEQANAFADYATGKTLEEVKGMALTETGAPKDADIASSVTIKVGDYILALEKAVANAKSR